MININSCLDRPELPPAKKWLKSASMSTDVTKAKWAIGACTDRLMNLHEKKPVVQTHCWQVHCHRDPRLPQKKRHEQENCFSVAKIHHHF